MNERRLLMFKRKIFFFCHSRTPACLFVIEFATMGRLTVQTTKSNLNHQKRKPLPYRYTETI